MINPDGKSPYLVNEDPEIEAPAKRDDRIFAELSAIDTSNYTDQQFQELLQQVTAQFALTNSKRWQTLADDLYKKRVQNRENNK